MALTPAQKAAIKADIEGDPILNAYPNNTDGAFAIADIYNELADPTFYVWATAVDPGVVEENGFVWAQVDNLTAKQIRIWDWMRSRTVNAAKGNVRVGINQGFTKDSTLWDSVMTHMSRPATRVEKLLAGGNGNGAGQGVPSTSDDKPAKLTYEGIISYQEIDTARNS